MNEFKVGDKARIIDVRIFHTDVKIGDMVEIIEVFGDNSFELKMLSGSYKGKLQLAFSSIDDIELVEPPINEIISLDYRVEYHNKVEECELLQAKYDYLWHTILKEK